MQKITFRKEDLALARLGQKPDFHSDFKTDLQANLETNLHFDFSPQPHALPELTPQIPQEQSQSNQIQEIQFNEIQQLKSSIKSLHIQVQALTDEKNQAINTAKQLEQALLNSEKDHQFTETRNLENLQSENQTLLHKHTALIEQNEAAKKEIEELQNTLQNTLFSHKVTSNETAALKDQIAVKDNNIHSYKNEIETLKTHIQVLERKLVESQNNKSQIDQANTSSYLKALFEKQQIEDELSAFKCEKMATSRRLQELSIENAALGKEFELSQEKNRSLIAALEAADIKRDELHHERMKLQDSLSEEKQRTLETALDLKEKELLLASEVAKNHENSLLILELEGIKEQEASLQNEYQQLLSQFHELETEHATLQDAFRSKIEETASLHELVSHRTSTLETVQLNLDTALREQTEQTQAYTELHESYSDQMGRIHNLEIDLTHCRDELQGTVNELNHFRALLNRYTQAEHLSIQLYELFREPNEQ